MLNSIGSICQFKKNYSFLTESRLEVNPQNILDLIPTLGLVESYLKLPSGTT